MNTDTLIRTKLQRPAIGPDILPRTRLIERLENGRYRKLTLISTPAGYGKSILASAWQETCSCLGAWLSLDVVCLEDFYPSIARTAVRRLLDRIENPDAPIEKIRAEARIRPGSSVRPRAD